MSDQMIANLMADYHWQYSIYAVLGIAALSLASKWLLTALVPTFRQSARVNQATYLEKMKKPAYAANQAWNRKWSLLYLAVIYGAILPFCLTMDAQPWWRVVRDVVVILMV